MTLAVAPLARRSRGRLVDWKLLVGASEADAEDADDGPPAASIELYNLANDPGEKTNLAPTQPEKVRELRARLDALTKDAVPPGAPGPKGKKR